MATIAKLLVALGLDSSEYSSGISRVEKQTRGLSSVLQNAAGTAMGFVGAIAGMEIIGNAIGFVTDSAIGMNATLETSTLQFTTLMGSADRATKHVKDLFLFAKNTPFETQPIIDASAQLQVFGGDALNTMANLTTFGDAAAATTKPLEEITFWSGRMYAALEAGKPIGEAIQNLQQLGVISPKAINKMQDMADAGAKGSEIWATYTNDLKKFNGAMALQAGTWQGLKSSISDSAHMLIATALKPLFDVAKSGLGAMLVWLGELEASGAITRFASNLASMIAMLFRLPTTVMPYVTKGIQLFNDILNINVIAKYIGYLGSWFDLIKNVGSALMQGDLSGAIDALFSDGINVAKHAGAFYNAVGELIGLVAGYIVTNAPKWGAAFVAWITPYIPIARTKLMELGTGIYNWIIEQVPVLKEKFMQWIKPATDWVSGLGATSHTKLSEFWNGIVTWVQTKPSELTNAFISWANATWAWIQPASVQFLAEWPGILNKFLDWIETSTGPLVTGFLEWGWAFTKWIAPQIPVLLLNLALISAAIVVWIAETAVILLDRLLQWGGAFLNWVEAKVIPKLPGVLGEIWNAIVGWIDSTSLMLYNAALPLGTNIVDGIKQGFINAWGGLTRSITSMTLGIPISMQDDLGIRSPSRVMADLVGKHMPTGILVGFQRTWQSVRNTMTGMVGKGMSEVMQRALGTSNNSSIASAMAGITNRARMSASANSPIGNAMAQIGNQARNPALINPNVQTGNGASSGDLHVHFDLDGQTIATHVQPKIIDGIRSGIQNARMSQGLT